MLPSRKQRTFREAYHRRVFGTPSQAWVERPGSSYDLEIWMTAFDIAAEENVSPWDALLLAVRRRAARVRQVDAILEAAWEDHRTWCRENDGGEGVNPDVPNDTVRVWLTESRNEERLLIRAAKMAVDAGVADAVVRRLEMEGKLAGEALMAGLDVLQLTPDERLRALTAMHTRLTTISGTGTDKIQQPRAIEGIAFDENEKKEE